MLTRLVDSVNVEADQAEAAVAAIRALIGHASPAQIRLERRLG